MKEISSNEFEKEVLTEGFVLVDFYSTECPPCEALAPKLESIENLFKNDIKFVKIFRQGNRDLATQLGVVSSPTLLFYKDGKEVCNRQTGGIKRAEILKSISFIIGIEKYNVAMSALKPIVTKTDVAILGGGPGGLTAGIYLCQAKVDTTLIDIALPGGYVATTHQVSNYPGFIDPQPGYMLAHYMTEQAKKYGLHLKVAVDVTKVDLYNKEIIIDEFETIKAKKIIIATGSSPNKLNVLGEHEYMGKGISYCATCDAKYFQDKEVVVIGGGNSAIEETDFITKFASKVIIINQFDKLQANKLAQEKAYANPKIEFLLAHEPRSFVKSGDKMLIEVENLKTKKISKIETDGVFIFIGLMPNTAYFGDMLKYDQYGYIATDEVKKTNVEGVYAVGDVTSKKYRQITTAVSDGTIAAISISRELN